MRDPRTAVMTMVEASWQDESGTLRTVPACMEVKSAGGACIRLKIPISVGSKLTVRWRFDTFTGTARNCRSEGREYLVGIQRDAADAPVVSPPAPPVAPVERVRSNDAQLSPAAAAAAWTLRMRTLRTPLEIKRQETKPQEIKLQSKPEETKTEESERAESKPLERELQATQQQKSRPTKTPSARASQEDKPYEAPSALKSPELKPLEIPVVHTPQESRPAAPPAPRKAEAVPFVRIARRATAVLPRRTDNDARIRDGPGPAQPPRSEPARSTQPQVKSPPQREDDLGKERKRMRPKWLGLAPWQHKQDALSDSRNGNHNTPGNRNDEGEKENFMSHATPPANLSMSIRKTAADSAGDDTALCPVDLLPMEDIYRAAGIMSPPKGYGIKKVVDMVNSEYVRALSKDMKRAAVLMALDAAGVPISQLQQDARARQDALDSYEAAQRKQVEAEWARKMEENVRIQAELERVKAHHMARIARNLDAIEREKATFSNWLAIKQQETHSMLEAAELCLKAPAPDFAEKSEAAKPESNSPEAKVPGWSDANPASDHTKVLLADTSLAKAAAAGSKSM
jgi:hypothetical protein